MLLTILDEEYKLYKQTIQDIDDKTLKLEKVVNELDAWSKQLEQQVNKTK